MYNNPESALSYGKALRSSFLPEWMSMNAMMAGMLPTMVILMTHDMRAMQATSPWFWVSMSAATLVGVVCGVSRELLASKK